MKDDNQNPMNNWNAMPTPTSIPPQLELKLFSSSYVNNDSPETATNGFASSTNTLSLPSSSTSTPLSSISYSLESYSNTIKNSTSLYWLHPKNSTIILSDDYKYPLLNDRKDFFAHLSMKQLSLCAVRIAGTQTALVFAHYFQDLMNYKLENDTLVWDDELTEEQAELLVKIWEEKEWTKRMKSIPERIYKAFFRIQSVALCMRYYECVLNHYCCTSIELMDLLTKDSLAYSRRQAASTIITRYTNDYFSKIFYVCLWSNCIGFLSDYTVTQLWLVCKFWYNCYYPKKKKNVAQDYLDGICNNTNSSNAIADAKNLLYVESGKLITIRFIGWIFSSMTAAAGGILYPKFGTLLFGNLGDSMISSMSD